MHGSTTSQLRINYFLAKLQLLAAHLRFLCPVTTELSQVISGIIEIKHGRGVCRKQDRFLFLMLDFTPSLDNIFFRISHIVQSNVYRILIVTEINHSFRTTLNRLGGGRNIIQHSGWITIIVSDSDSRFKVIFITRTTIHFPTAFTYTTVGTGMDIPLKVIQILLMQQFFT